MYQNVPLQRLQIQLAETEKPVYSFHNGMSSRDVMDLERSIPSQVR